MLLWHQVMFSQLVFVGSLVATPTHLLVTHVGPCGDSPRTVLTLEELSITAKYYGSTLSGEFNITEDIENGWTARVTMQKCQDMRNTNTCDHFSSSLVVRDGCGAGDDNAEEMYTMLFHYAKPKLDCPIRAGVYKLDKYPFFTEDNFLTVSESKISTSVFGYTVRVEGTTVDMRKFFCVEAYLQLLYMREHNWLAGATGTKNKYSYITPSSSVAPTLQNNQEEE